MNNLDQEQAYFKCVIIKNIYGFQKEFFYPPTQIVIIFELFYAAQGGVNLFLNGIVLGTLYYGGYLLSNQRVTPGDLMSFLVATQTIQRSLGQMSLLFGQVIKGAIYRIVGQTGEISPQLKKGPIPLGRYGTSVH